MTLRCSVCKRFVSHNTITYMENQLTDAITEVKGKCKRCGIVAIDWCCYEEVCGFG